MRDVFCTFVALILVTGAPGRLLAAPGAEDFLGPKSEITQADRDALRKLEALFERARQLAPADSLEAIETPEFLGAIEAARKNYPVFPIGVEVGKPSWRKHLFNTRSFRLDAFRFVTPTKGENLDLFWLFVFPNSNVTFSWSLLEVDGGSVPFGVYGQIPGLALEDQRLPSRNIARVTTLLGQLKPGKEYICYFIFSELQPLLIHSAMVVAPAGTEAIRSKPSMTAALGLKPANTRSRTWFGTKQEFMAAIEEDPALLTTLDEYGDLPIHWAVRSSNVEYLKLLLDKGVNVNARSKTRSTPLHYTSLTATDQTARLLIECGADLNARDEIGATPLFRAAERKNLDLVRLLVDSKAEVNLATFANEPPLHIALGRDGDEVVRYLLDHGARVTFSDARGARCLHRAATLNCSEQIKMLLEKHVDIECRDQENKTPLMRAFGPPAATTLLDCGANLDAHTKDGRNALHFAVELGRVELAEVLLDRGIRVNAEGSGWTALQLAAAKGDQAMCTLLLKHRADPLAKTGDGLDSAGLAERNGHASVAELLRKNAGN